ncbi:MAG: hypothetical protein ACD_3C00006G0003 [uncultured bacterium (gcode 4)]|uniref:Uncharacterized protein n=1 Tax=uncultured bacterium (gcode 4) TaxID=1234023 RepID=K2FCL5_9BACT|nr:MAG: hypothetical protein ACD_3C00006G0003 [uncultured bacterium (gcode 4)]
MNIWEIEIYELKKNVVLTSLLALKWHWVLAESLYETIKAEWASPELIDSIIEMFEIAVDSVKDEWNRERIRQTLDSLSIIKEKERLEREKEENEAIIVLENY